MKNLYSRELGINTNNWPSYLYNMENKRFLSILSVLIVVMAGVVGIVSQKINSIQLEAEEEQNEADVEYVNARGMEGVENQRILEDLLLLTEAKAQKSFIDSGTATLETLESQYNEVNMVLSPDIIDLEIKYFYLKGNKVFEEKWAENSVINQCYRKELSCEVYQNTLSGSDNTNEAVEIVINLNALNSSSPIYIFSQRDNLEFDGFYSPLVYTDQQPNELIIQFPLYYENNIAGISNQDLLWQNIGYIYMENYINEWISEYNYQADVCETNLNFVKDWVSTHKNNAASAERIWLTNQQIADTYYANGDDSMGDNVSENADWWFEERNRLMNLSNENKSLSHDWETMLYENTTQIYTYETWLNEEKSIIDTQFSQIQSEISRISAITLDQSELKNQIDELSAAVTNSENLMMDLILVTNAFELGFLDEGQPDFAGQEEEAYRLIMHNESTVVYDDAYALEQSAKSSSSRLETLSTSIVFLSMSNMILGASAGMVKQKKNEKDIVEPESNRNVMLLSAVGGLLGLIGILLYFIS